MGGEDSKGKEEMKKLAAYVFIGLTITAILQLSALHILLLGDFMMEMNRRAVPTHTVPSVNHDLEERVC